MLSQALEQIGRWLRPQPKLLCWSLPNFFALRGADGPLQTNSITVQNVGRRPAFGVEIVQKPRPRDFELYPAVAYRESIGPNGEHVIQVPHLAPREWVVIHMFSYRDPPVLNDIRCGNGTVQWVQMQPQRVWPKWLRSALLALTLIGLGALMYWVIEGLSYLGSLL